MNNDNGHTLYKPSDFTDEEIENGNTLAEVVRLYDLDVCKTCGRYESELSEQCNTPRSKD